MIVITSPEKRCGKTLLLELLGVLVAKPIHAANITPPALFRVIERYAPTLLVDEVDTFLGDNEALRGILNAGHRRSSAFVIRLVGDTFEPRSFSVWGAKALSLIGGLPSTIEDRSIVIEMRRKTRDERVERFRHARVMAELAPLRQKIVRWVGDHFEALRRVDAAVPPELHDRAADNWRPLLAIAELAGCRWAERAREVASLLSGASMDAGDSTHTQLLFDLRQLFLTRKTDALTSQDIVAELACMEDRPYPEWYRGQPISTRQLAVALRSFGIGPRQVWIKGANLKGYRRADFEDAFLRYLPLSEGLGGLEPSTGAAFSPICDGLERPSPSPSENASNPHGYAGSSPLAPASEGMGRGNTCCGRKTR